MALPAALEGKLALPVIGSPMFIVSSPELVIAQCTSGIVGSFPALNARPREELERWIDKREERPKAWKDVWGAGQGVGSIDDIPPAREVVARLCAEYEAAKQALSEG